MHFIDALRGWAVLAVIAVHVAKEVPDLPKVVIRTAEWGRYGVQLFFVISAFTMFHTLRQRAGRDAHPTRAFYVRRLFPIGPLFWAAIAFYLLWDGMGPQFWAPNGIAPWQVGLTAAFAHGWTPESINSVVPGGWTIAAEVVFYAFVPLLFRVITTPGRALAVVPVAIVTNLLLVAAVRRVAPAVWPDVPPYLIKSFVGLWLPAHVAVFALGFVLYFLVSRAGADARQRDGVRVDAAWGLPLIVAGGYVAAAAAAGGSPLVPPHVGCSVGFVLLAWGLSLRPLPVLVNRYVRHAGLVSYSAYLSHFAVLAVVSPRVASLTAGWPPVAVLAFVYAATVVLTLAVSTATFHVVEEPGRKLGQRLLKPWRIDTTPAAAIVAP